jgi:UDP-glucose 4-epimerase
MHNLSKYSTYLYNLKILVTGSAGLIGSSVTRRLHEAGAIPVCYDLRESGDAHGDVLDFDDLASRMEECSGIIHLAAVSRVVQGEQDPDKCRSVNIGGVKNVLKAVGLQPQKPWLIFASSREVYGEPSYLPVNENHPLKPLNVYGETKLAGEVMVHQAISDNHMPGAVLRFSNVYGSPDDYHDRVIPAFVRAALTNESLRVDGADNLFDFTFVEDVTCGILQTASMLVSHQHPMTPVHLVSGTPISLEELARLAIQLTNSSSEITFAPPRNYDVARFFGDPCRAEKILGWTAETTLPDGLSKLAVAIRQFIEHQPA